VLSAAYGVTGVSRFGQLEYLNRPLPSAGGLYPLELFVIARNVTETPPGVYHYAVMGHGLEQRRDTVPPAALSTYLFMGQDVATQAQAVIVITAALARNLEKYGDRGYRYVLLEAGHCAQNINHAASGFKLGSCNLGGFFDRELADLLRVDIEAITPLYAIAVGVPQNKTLESLRGVS
jgi:SagB-type dehydrogenase family enzyme